MHVTMRAVRMMKRGWRALTAAAAAAALGAAVTFVPAAPVAAAGGCGTVRIPVSMTQQGPASQVVSAWYCPGRQSTVNLFVPGATYNHDVWTKLGFAAQVTAPGQAIFAYDRPGTGASSRPPAAAVTVRSEAWVLHQLITWLRARGYRDVNVIGHSLGSIIATEEAGTWPSDPSRLVLTGFSHELNPPGVAQLAASVVPACPAPSLAPVTGLACDPRFAGQRLSPTWETTLPGTRASLFYAPGTASPAVLAWDEAHKDLLSAYEFAAAALSVLTPLPLNVSRGVTAPVLILNGSLDKLFCGGSVCTAPQRLAAAEQPFFPRTLVRAMLIPRTGHDVTTSTTVAQASAGTRAWLASTRPQASR